LTEWKSKAEKKKELSEERKENAKSWSEYSRQQDNAPSLRGERKIISSKRGASWAFSSGFMRGFTISIFNPPGVCLFLAGPIPYYYFGNYMSNNCHYCSAPSCIE